MLYVQSHAGFSLFFSCSCFHSPDVSLKRTLLRIPKCVLKGDTRTIPSTSILGQVHLLSPSSPSVLYPHQVAMLLLNPPEFQTVVVTRISLFCSAPVISARKLYSLFNARFPFKAYPAVKSSLTLSEGHKGTSYLTLGFWYWTDCRA